MGRFVVFEGGEGSGKSTQAALLARRWGAELTFEPGDSEVGARLRSILLDPATGHLDPRAEALLMAADRAHHVATRIRPALNRGRDVVCDRYVGSSIAYQGYGRELGADAVGALSAFATDGLVPDLVVLLHVEPEVAASRLAAAGAPDRLEAAGDEFHRRVASGFLHQAAEDQERWVVVDGDGSVDEVAERATAVVNARLPDPVAGP
ncbi:dTMP kinase [Aquihabitans sp. G128]|uniref:dTMP kinase n=1 Tax=Aquihabitans sp. G128 TaxID=2849779 RepID=UPI001C21E123|nr:dTMP kinase [Aquihabitans sp. G128]QXC59289.1 dTMP kinase [Aquihabitans sp. G128]